MKIYFIVIIVVLVVVIMLLFFLLYKIYLLHVKANDEVLEEEERPLKDEVEDEKDAGADLWPTKFEDKQPVDQMDGKSLAPDKGEKVLTTVQPSIQKLVGPNTPTLSRHSRNGSLKEKPSVTMSFEYSSEKSALKITITRADHLPKSKNGSSEAYIDMQLSPYKFRTYRTPGYRRPLRGCLQRPVDFRLEPDDVRLQYFVLFVLRYDPFSRLKVDGEIVVKLTDLDQDTFLKGETVVFKKDLEDSQQEFTAFIFRPK